MPFTSMLNVRFEDSDMGGISFFANVYRFAHRAFEDFVIHLGYGYPEWFQNPEWGLPLRHSEANYFMPLFAGEKYQIKVLLEKIGESSFTARYEISKDAKVHCEVRLVHTFFNKKARAKMAIPSAIRTRLETYQRECLSAK